MYRTPLPYLTCLVIFLAACSDNKPAYDSNKRLFTLECSSPTTCTRTAKSFLVNVDGIFIEPSPEFIKYCREPVEERSPYCQNMIVPGETETFEASAAAIKELQRSGFNPWDSDAPRRFNIALDKLYADMD